MADLCTKKWRPVRCPELAASDAGGGELPMGNSTSVFVEVVGGYSQGPQAPITASRSSVPTMPSPLTSPFGCD